MSTWPMLICLFIRVHFLNLIFHLIRLVESLHRCWILASIFAFKCLQSSFPATWSLLDFRNCFPLIDFPFPAQIHCVCTENFRCLSGHRQRCVFMILFESIFLYVLHCKVVEVFNLKLCWSWIWNCVGVEADTQNYWKVSFIINGILMFENWFLCVWLFRCS